MLQHRSLGEPWKRRPFSAQTAADPFRLLSSRVAAGAPTVRILQHGLSLLGWGFRYSDFSLRLFLSFSLAAFLWPKRMNKRKRNRAALCSRLSHWKRFPLFTPTALALNNYDSLWTVDANGRGLTLNGKTIPPKTCRLLHKGNKEHWTVIDYFFSVFAFEGNRLPVLSIHLFTKERSVDEAARNTSIKGNAPLKIIGFWRSSAHGWKCILVY